MIDKVVTQTGGADKEAAELREKILDTPNREISGGTVYYVSDKGDDANDGLSPGSAVRTYNHIAELPLKAGDSVLLERGSVFRAHDMLWITDGVYYGAYGEGEKPKVLGSLRDYADPCVWEETEKNIWSTPIPCGEGIAERAGVALFNDETYIGEWKYTKSELGRDGDYCHDPDAGIFYLYFEGGNPGEYFDNIEIATTRVAVRGGYNNNVTVENICFKYNTFGPFLMGECSGITVRNCELGWHGGRIFSMRNGRPLRYGNALEFWHLAENITVENCWVYQVFDAAMTFQGHGSDDSGAIFRNIKFDNNLIEYCCMNIEYWAGRASDKPPVIENISYKGNIIRMAGYGWGGIYRWDKEDQACLLGWGRKYDEVKNFVVTENIIDCADCYMIWMQSPDVQKGFEVYGNTFYQKPYSGTHSCIEVIKDLGLKASGQQEFESAIKTFDKNAKLIKWLDN